MRKTTKILAAAALLGTSALAQAADTKVGILMDITGPIASFIPPLQNAANLAVKQVNDKEIVLSEGLANPQRMVQIAMAVRSVPYSDIVFVQYPTVYAEGGGRVLPVTSAADVLFEALAANQPLQLTGSTSDGYGTEVVGEATAPTTATPAPTDSATPDAAATEAPAATETPVQLPASITGQTAAQVTCTVAQQ